MSEITRRTDIAINKLLSFFKEDVPKYFKIPVIRTDIKVEDYITEFCKINDLDKKDEEEFTNLIKQYQINTLSDTRIGAVIFNFIQQNSRLNK